MNRSGGLAVQREPVRAQSLACSIVDRAVGVTQRRPFRLLASHVQVLRNHSVGSRCSGAVSGPRFVTVIADQNVVGVGFGVLDEDVEVAILIEDPGVDQLEFGILPGPAAVYVEQC